MARSRLTKSILAGMIFGACLGVLLKEFSDIAWVHDGVVEGLFYVMGKIFIASLKMLVVPLVFVSLVCGVTNLTNIRTLGRLGAKTVALYMVTTGVAISMSLVLASIFQPGVGFELTTDATFNPNAAPGLREVIVGIFPSNPVKAAAEGRMLQIIVCAILFGVSLVMVGKEAASVSKFFNQLNEVIMKMVTILIGFAPYGVFALMVRVFYEQGLAAIAPMAMYFGLVIASLLIHLLVTYMGLLRLFTDIHPLEFFSKVKSVMLFAFSTASSNATIPLTMTTVTKELKVDKSVSSFTVPLGATINMDGTAIMQGVATIFIANAYNISLSLTQLVTIVFMATLASIGTAGVPGVGLITLAMVLTQVGVPTEGIGLILGVDRLLDMARTAVNVCGDMTVSCIVQKGEKKSSRRLGSQVMEDRPQVVGPSHL